MPLPRHSLPLLLLPALLGVGGPAGAAPPSGQRVQHNDEALSDSVRRIERSTRGQVLSAERVPYDGRNVNRIKVVDDRGRVRIYMDDPQSSQRSESQQSESQQQSQPPTRGDDD